MSRSWSIKKALFFLIGSSCMTLAGSGSAIFLWKKHQEKKRCDEKYQITSIIQTGPEKEALKTIYLAELLDLSIDQKKHLYAFDLKEAKKKLLASPLIANAKIKRLPPSTLYIDYEVRKPIAWLSDFKNTAVDREGYIFPVVPFISPKRLPEIYLGCPINIGQNVKGKKFQLASDLLSYLDPIAWQEGFYITRIDVSKADALSLGQKEIVLITEEEIFFRKNKEEISCIFPKILRLSPKNYQEQLHYFLTLRKSMQKDYEKQLMHLKRGGCFAPRIIDLRIPKLAFVEKG